MSDLIDHPEVILLVEDDEDHYLLAQEAIQETQFSVDLRRVKNGEELLDYLLHRGSYQDPEKSPRPRLILLDLNMPRKGGREALQEIKSHPDLRLIPVIILTTSKNDEDMIGTYSLGAGSFIRKPVHFNDFVQLMKILIKYWVEIVEVPRF